MILLQTFQVFACPFPSYHHISRLGPMYLGHLWPSPTEQTLARSYEFCFLHREQARRTGRMLSGKSRAMWRASARSAGSSQGRSSAGTRVVTRYASLTSPLGRHNKQSEACTLSLSELGSCRLLGLAQTSMSVRAHTLRINAVAARRFAFKFAEMSRF